MKSTIYIIISVILIFLFQVSLMSFVGNLSYYINPILISLILISLFYGLRHALFWAIAGGFLLDLYSIQNFGIHTLSLFFTTVLVHYFFKKFITNRTLYSFIILSSVSTIFYFTISSLLSFISFNLSLSAFSLSINSQYILNISLQIIFNTLIVMIVYFIVHRFSDRLKTDVILKGNI